MVSCYPRCSRTPHNGYVANSMRGTIRSFRLFEAATFFVASLIHIGVSIAGYEHQKARIAEGVIALVLLTGRDIDLDPGRRRHVRRDWPAKHSPFSAH